MMRLTPSKIYGVRLPHKSRRLTKRGNTSLIYTTDDPALLEVYTIEWLKFDWWKHLGITEGYEDVGHAVYYGFKHNYYGGADWKRIEMIVYRCLVDRLQMPDAEQLREIRRLRKLMDSLLTQAWGRSQQKKIAYNIACWDILQDNGHILPEILPAVNWIKDYNDGYETHPDFGLDDFAIRDGQIICIDPFHHADIHKAFALTKRGVY